MVHRVVGLPGERLEPAADGTLLVNGAPLIEPYLLVGIKTYLKEAVDIPADHYMLMGDNRQDSSDSRLVEVTKGKGDDGEDCPVSDQSTSDPRTAPPLTLKDADPPALQLLTQTIITMTAANLKVTGDNLDSAHTDVTTETDRLEGLLGRVPADGSEADRIVRTEMVPALRALGAAQTLAEWTARHNTFAVVMSDHARAMQGGLSN